MSFSPGNAHNNIGTLTLIKPKYINLTIQNSVVGDNDLVNAATGLVYTVPAGRVAILLGMRIFNDQAAASSTFFMELKVGGVYFRVTSNAALAAQAASGSPSPIGMVMQAGDIFALNCTQTAQSAWISVIECDATTQVKTARILTLANGDNTLYTCPAGKTAILLSNIMEGIGPEHIFYVNNSGGAINVHHNIVNNGGVPNGNNQQSATLAVANQTGVNIAAIATLGPGDFVNINVSAGTATQTAWVTVIEV